MSEIFKLLDNNEIDETRGDIKVEQEVTEFINFIFRLGKDKTFSQKVLHEDVIRLLQSTELYTYVEQRFPVFFISSDSILNLNYWTDLYVILRANRPTVNRMLSYYGSVFSTVGDRGTFEFLRGVWNDHRNTVYALSAVIIIHLLGMKILKDMQC